MGVAGTSSRRGGAGVYEPIVGMVVTISPSLSLYRMVVFPAASSPTIKILISFLPQRRSNSFENVRPILAVVEVGYQVVSVVGGKGTRSRVLCSARGSVSIRVVGVARPHCVHARFLCAEGREYACLERIMSHMCPFHSALASRQTCGGEGGAASVWTAERRGRVGLTERDTDS